MVAVATLKDAGGGEGARTVAGAVEESAALAASAAGAGEGAVLTPEELMCKRGARRVTLAADTRRRGDVDRESGEQPRTRGMEQPRGRVLVLSCCCTVGRVPPFAAVDTQAVPAADTIKRLFIDDGTEVMPPAAYMALPGPV